MGDEYEEAKASLVIIVAAVAAIIGVYHLSGWALSVWMQ